MIVWVPRKLRSSLAAGLGAAAVVLAAGCGASPGAPAAPATAFKVFPLPTRWNNAVIPATDYLTVLSVASGAGPRTFSIPGQPALMFWLGCLGTGGSATISSAGLPLHWSLPCGSDGDPSAVVIDPTHATAGQQVKVLLTAPATAHWELRVDAPEKTAVKASPAAPTATP
jgi:hypothetical protein